MKPRKHSIRVWREKRHLTQESFAELLLRKSNEMNLSLACDARQVGRWERGDASPSPAYRRLIHAVTGLDMYETPDLKIPSINPEDLPTDQDHIIAFIPEPQGGYRMRILRREFIERAGVMVSLASIPGRPERVTPSVVDHLEKGLGELSRLDQLLGAGEVIGTARAQMSLIEDLVSQASGDVQTRLLRTAARYAELLGWMNQDTGNTLKALYWSDRAIEYAGQAEDAVTVAYVLARKSVIAQARSDHSGHGQTALTYADQAAQYADRLPPYTRAFIHGQQANSRALVGDEFGSMVAIDAARTALDNVGPDDRSHLGRFCTPGNLDVSEAWCFRALGKPDKSVTLYRGALTEWPSHRRRGKGRQLVRLATCHARTNEPEQAVKIALDALPIVDSTGSALALDELRTLRTDLAPYRDVPEVQDFIPELSRAI